MMQIKGAVLISASPGLKDKLARKIRAAKDDSRARSVTAHGLQLFLSSWYAGEMWKRLFLTFRSVIFAYLTILE
jgi:isochorismate synthase / 2-succinyl-5-enolpyruvyl-6-hydroxy-3-cyclohexene-1-carboxylate synthase / 2-succinyl-6-hydroxy-2,4-cyclohexadiene-1-carboxylate synthase / o-succinylbenzoate synthase